MASADELKARLAKMGNGDRASPEALAARLGGNAPTGATGRPTLLDSAKAVLGQDVATLRGVQDSLTFGYDDEIAAALSAPFRSLASQFGDQPVGLGDAYRAAHDEMSALKSNAERDYSSAFMMGQGPGLFARGLGASQLATKASDALEWVGKAPRVVNAAIRTATQGAAGALDASTEAGGDDADMSTAAMIGGAFGAIGNVIGEVGSNLINRGSPEVIKERLANRVFGTLAELDPTTTPEQMVAARRSMGPDAMVADTSPALREAISGIPSSGTEVDPSAVGALYEQSLTRDTGEYAVDALRGAFSSGPTSQAARAADKAQRLATLGGAYKAQLETMDKSGLTIKPAAVVSRAREVFGERPVGGFATALNELEKAVNTLGEFDKGLNDFNRPLTPSDLVTLKQRADQLILAKENGQSTFDRGTRAKLIEFKNSVNAFLKDRFEGYKEVTQQYAGEFEINSAFDEGRAGFKTDPKMTTEDALDYYNTLSDAGKDSYREGLVYSLFAEAEAVDPQALLKKKVSSDAKSSTLLTKIDRMFGPDVAEQIQLDADRLITFAQTNKMTDQLRSALAKASAGDTQSRGLLRRVMDTVTVATMGAQGNIHSGAFFGSASRMGVSDASSLAGKVNTAMLDFAGQSGDSADSAIYALADYFRNPSKAKAPLLNVGPLANLGRE